MRAFFRKFWRNPSGASAAEFALVAPVFFALTIGAINLCIVLYMNSRLQFSVDDAARCAALAYNPCDPVARATSDFGFASLTPSFPPPTALTTDCQGTKMTGSVTYTLNAVVTTIAVPISASSCFAQQ